MFACQNDRQFLSQWADVKEAVCWRVLHNEELFLTHLLNVLLDIYGGKSQLIIT